MRWSSLRRRARLVATRSVARSVVGAAHSVIDGGPDRGHVTLGRAIVRIEQLRRLQIRRAVVGRTRLRSPVAAASGTSGFCVSTLSAFAGQVEIRRRSSAVARVVGAEVVEVVPYVGRRRRLRRSPCTRPVQRHSPRNSSTAAGGGCAGVASRTRAAGRSVTRAASATGAARGGCVTGRARAARGLRVARRSKCCRPAAA